MDWILMNLWMLKLISLAQGVRWKALSIAGMLWIVRGAVSR